MFDLIHGLPAHALVVHAVVVLLPLSALGLIGVALVPALRRRYALLVAVGSLVSTLLVPVATKSGHALAERVGNPGYHHQQLGEQLIWFAIPMTVMAVLVLVLAWRSGELGLPSRPGPTGTGGATRLSPSRSRAGAPVIVVTVLAVVAAVATGVQVYRVGDAGSRAVWTGAVTSGR